MIGRQTTQPRQPDLLRQLLLPLGYTLDYSEAQPFYWKHIEHGDTEQAYAFTLVMVTLQEGLVRIEGLNEPMLRKAIRSGRLDIESPEDVEALKELIFEGDLEAEERRLRNILPFLEQQLQALEEEAPQSEGFRRALNNLALLVESASGQAW